MNYFNRIDKPVPYLMGFEALPDGKIVLIFQRKGENEMKITIPEIDCEEEDLKIKTTGV